jgi:high affinity sulfate transporter 1
MRSPFASWLWDYKPGWWKADLIAGATTAAVVIPQAMAYAAVAGLPVEVGLYCSLAAMLTYPLLGSSRPLSVTTTSSLAMLTATAVAAAAAVRPAASPVSIAVTLALLVGVFLLIARLLRLGFLANFISKPVLVGFQAGVGVAIIVGQLKAVLGVQIASRSTVDILTEAVAMAPRANGLAVLTAATGVVVLLGLPRLLPKVPAALVWVGSSIVAAAVLGLASHGVRAIGPVPAGLPRLTLPDLALARVLAPAALGVALMSFTETMAAARAFRANDDPPVDANRELVAIGVANVASSLVGGMPAGGGTSQTAVADGAGARSQMAQWLNAGVVLATLLVASRVLSLMPQSALAAVIIVTGVSMIRPVAFNAIAKVRRDELLWALATVVGVIFIGTLNGILVAVAISLLTLFYQANHPPVYALVYDRAGDLFRRAAPGETDERFPRLLMLGTEGRLTFANAETVRDKMRALIAQAQPDVIILECEAIPDIEYTALLMLIEDEQDLRRRGIALWLAAVNPELRVIIDRSPLAEALGPERIFLTRHKALDAYQVRGTPQASSGAPPLARA